MKIVMPVSSLSENLCGFGLFTAFMKNNSELKLLRISSWTF